MLSREGLREYAGGSLWVLPSVASLVAVIAGLTMSQVRISPNSRWAALAFQGTADDARSLLIIICGTVVTVMAVVLGLTVVALQLASTQFSPRLLRNFLRDRGTQLVLSVFVGTFVYSIGGLFTVGVLGGRRTEEFPRIAVSGALILLLLSLAMVVYFADHLVHSIQIDAVTGAVQRNVLKIVEQLPGTFEEDSPKPPPWAVPVIGLRSGYIQVAHPHSLLPVAGREGVCIALRYRVGQHVVAGTELALAWRPSPNDSTPDPQVLARAVDAAVRIGFERTLRQDVAFGMRQLVDMSCKALWVWDPYTAIQAIDHLSVIFSAIATRPMGDHIAQDADGTTRVIVPGRRFGDYLPGMCGLIRRYGGSEPSVLIALLRLLENCARLVGDDRVRRTAINNEVGLIVSEAESRIGQPHDLALVKAAADAVRSVEPTRPAQT